SFSRDWSSDVCSSDLIRVGDDGTAYPETLRAMVGWDDFSIPSLILGLAFAAPMIARIRPRRNPALYLAGPSSSGKTTLIQFAVRSEERRVGKEGGAGG